MALPLRRRALLVLSLVLTASGAVALASPSTAATYTPGVTTFVAIDDGSTDPYPLSVTAEGMGGAITDVDVEIPDLYHARPWDLDLLLVAPSGTKVYLKAQTWCEYDLNYDRPHVSWTLSDQAANNMNSSSCGSGWWQPSVSDWTVSHYSLPAPAPQGPYANHLSALNGQNPNGTWRLYASDQVTGAQGELGQGFRVIISTAPTGAVIGNANGDGPASVYPLTQNVTGDGQVAEVQVVLSGLSHTNPADLDVVVVGPNKRAVVLMSDTCGSDDLTNVILAFSSRAAYPLSPEGVCRSGTFKPTDYPPSENLPAPAPPGPYETSLDAFVGSKAAGAWKVYINDDQSGGSGYVGYVILRVQLYPETTITTHPRATVTSRRPLFEFTSNMTGSTFQCRLDHGPWEGCTSPRYYGQKIALGSHAFRVRATSPTGFTDRSPAKWTWRITG